MMMTLVGKHMPNMDTHCNVEIGPEPLALVALPLKDRFLHNVLLLTIQTHNLE
jgi:hypothetical protein